MEPLVTVLITSYNPGPFLLEALESVFLQTYTGWKIVLVDDCSTDNSLLHANRYLDHPKVQVIQNTKNLGQSKSLNIGLGHTQTPYVIQLDSDDWFFHYTLEVLLREASKLPKHIGVISGNINMVFQNKNGQTIKNRVKKGRAFQDPYDFLLANTSIWPRFYRTKALKSLGGWPTDDPFEGRYVEDLRILFRLIESYHFHWIDKLLLNHRRHGNNLTYQRSAISNTVEWAIRDALQRWGNRYEPVFKSNFYGWKEVVGLVPKKRH